MPPEEEKPSQVAPETAVQGDEWDGPWGSISPVPHSVETLCVQIENEPGRPRIYYYPYRTIGKWNWNMDLPETLEIQVGGIQLTICGTGLRKTSVPDALIIPCSRHTLAVLSTAKLVILLKQIFCVS